MKTVTQIEEASLSSGLETTAMGMVLNATSFNHIINSLYKNPLGAIIRELTTNALESHMVAKTNRKVAIQLPTTLDQSLVIRDFGTGLDDEEVQKYLNTLFSTSKDKDNNLMGGFGLGSKSPLALVDTFNIISIKGGLKNNYAWIKEPGKLPSLVHLDDEEDRNERTTEDDGIKIVIPLGSSTKISQTSLQSKVEEEARRQLLGFSNQIMFVDNINEKHYADLKDITSTIIKEKLVLDLDHVSLYKKDPNTNYPHSNTMLIMIGGVNYPFADCYRTYVRSLSKYFIDAESDYIMCLKAPIGALELPMSREEILTTSHNEKVLQKAAEDAGVDIAKHIKSLNINLDVSLADFYKQLKNINGATTNGVQFNLKITQDTFEEKDKPLHSLSKRLKGSKLNISSFLSERMPSNLLQALTSNGDMTVNIYDKNGTRDKYSFGYGMYIHNEPKTFVVTTSPLPSNVSHRLLFNFIKDKLKSKHDIVVVQMAEKFHQHFEVAMKAIKTHSEYFLQEQHEYLGVIDTKEIAAYKEEIRLLNKTAGRTITTRASLDYIPGVRISNITGAQSLSVYSCKLHMNYTDTKINALEDALTGKRIPIGPQYIDIKHPILLTHSTTLPIDLQEYADPKDPVSVGNLRNPKNFSPHKQSLYTPMKDFKVLKVASASFNACLARLEDAGYTVYTEDKPFKLSRPTLSDIPPKNLGDTLLNTVVNIYTNRLGLWSRSHDSIANTTVTTIQDLVQKQINDPIYRDAALASLAALNKKSDIFRLYPPSLEEYKGYDFAVVKVIADKLAVDLLKEVTTKPDTEFNRNLYDLVSSGLNKDIFNQILSNLISIASQGKP